MGTSQTDTEDWPYKHSEKKPLSSRLFEIAFVSKKTAVFYNSCAHYSTQFRKEWKLLREPEKKKKYCSWVTDFENSIHFVITFMHTMELNTVFYTIQWGSPLCCTSHFHIQYRTPHTVNYTRFSHMYHHIYIYIYILTQIDSKSTLSWDIPFNFQIKDHAEYLF